MNCDRTYHIKESPLTRREDEGAPLGRIKLVQPCANCFELAFRIKIIFDTKEIKIKTRPNYFVVTKVQKCTQNVRKPREFRTFWVRETLV